jgi:hypothetical protein
MVVATITNQTERFELKSLPGGYVVIRQMSYGEKLNRQTQMTSYQMLMSGSKGADTKMDIEMHMEKVAKWEFSNLITEHNLTDEAEKALNFKNVADVDRLNPVVGEEIQVYINQLNAFEDDEDVKN